MRDSPFLQQQKERQRKADKLEANASAAKRYRARQSLCGRIVDMMSNRIVDMMANELEGVMASEELELDGQ